MRPNRLVAKISTVVGALVLVSGGSVPGAAATAPDSNQIAPLPALGALGANYNENLDYLN